MGTKQGITARAMSHAYILRVRNGALQILSMLPHHASEFCVALLSVALLLFFLFFLFFFFFAALFCAASSASPPGAAGPPFAGHVGIGANSHGMSVSPPYSMASRNTSSTNT